MQHSYRAGSIEPFSKHVFEEDMEDAVKIFGSVMAPGTKEHISVWI